MSVLDPLYNLVARGVIVFHNILSPIFGKHSFFAYAIAIAIIVVIVRILIFPLFVRSVRAQRTMQMLQPRIKEIREKYKNDKQRMNQEVMKLQKEHGNPLLGCLPLLLQIPLFISLYHVFNAVARTPTVIASGPSKGMLLFKGTSGLTGGVYDRVNNTLGTVDAAGVFHAGSKGSEVAGLATAKFAGITLSSALTSSKKTLDLFGANGTTVKIVAAIMIVFMAVTVYITQHQIMSRGGPVDPQQQKIQRLMLYGSPIMLAVFGLRFPIAVLVYWLTTNTWSMCQQVFILRKMPPVLPGTTAGAATSGRASAPRARVARVARPACARVRYLNRRRRPRSSPRYVRRLPSILPRTRPRPLRRRRETRASRMPPPTRGGPAVRVPARAAAGRLGVGPSAVAVGSHGSSRGATTGLRRNPRAKDHERADGDEQHRPGLPAGRSAVRRSRD